MARDRWSEAMSVHLPDDVDVEVRESEGVSPWFSLRSQRADGDHEVTFFGSAGTARRVADGVSAWAEALEALEGEESER